MVPYLFVLAAVLIFREPGKNKWAIHRRLINQKSQGFCFQLCTVPHFFLGFLPLPWFPCSLGVSSLTAETRNFKCLSIDAAKFIRIAFDAGCIVSETPNPVVSAFRSFWLSVGSCHSAQRDSIYITFKAILPLLKNSPINFSLLGGNRWWMNTRWRNIS